MSVRVLLASPNKGSGGITRWTEHILTYYSNHKCEALKIDLLPMNRHSLHGHFVIRSIQGIWDYSKIVQKEWHLLKNGQYDVIHISTSAHISLVKDYIMICIARHYHVRTILHFHFGRILYLYKEKGWEWKLLNSVMKMVDVAIPIDHASFQALSSAGFKNIVEIPNPLAPSVTDYVNIHEGMFLRDEKMILFAGNCFRSKGVYELINACKDIDGIRLVLVGHIDNTIKEDLIRITNGHSWLELLGQKSWEEVLLLMMKCGIFVLPSYSEGFPNVILESMACGCAIVGTKVGAIPEMIGEEDGRPSGLLIPPQNTEKLRKAIVTFLDDENLRYDCRINAKQRVIEKYKMEIVWKNLSNVWLYQ